MDAPPARRAAAAFGALLGVLVLAGCSVVVAGRPLSPQTTRPAAVPDSTITIVGAADDPVDAAVRNALADLQDYWTGQFPGVFGTEFRPLAGGYFSVDPNDIDPARYPDGIGCGQDPRAVEGNAFYCAAPNTPHSDSISYDRAFLGELADRFGRFIPDLVIAHEYGHAVQARVGAPGSSIQTETQADCFAGSWTSWVAAGKARHARLRASELDQLLQGYLLLRDPIGTNPAAQAAHGSGFDRVSAFQEGFDKGPTACRDDFGPDRVFTQSPFTSDQDLLNRGNAPYAQLPALMQSALTEFWQREFPAVFRRQFGDVRLQPFEHTPPACAPPDLDLVYCSEGRLVGYDDPDLGRPAYQQIGDYAVITAVSIGYGLAARDQLGRPAEGGAAYRSAICLTGWFSSEVLRGRLRSTQISPGDLDESAQFLLQYARDPSVLPGVQRTGFRLVDLFRSGFLDGPGACDVGV